VSIQTPRTALSFGRHLETHEHDVRSYTNIQKAIADSTTPLPLKT
jgi:hypothetical protein